ncbi:MAG: hypothetical protein ACK5LL_15055 [Suipraeoptans sp.]
MQRKKTRKKIIKILLVVVLLLLVIVSISIYTQKDVEASVIDISEVNDTYRFNETATDFYESISNERSKSKIYTELLKGVKAIDNRDGDLSSEVMVEKIVQTSEGNVVVHYAVADDSKNVGKAQIEIKCEFLEEIEETINEVIEE